MPEDRIPDAFRFKFLEQAEAVCELAKVDYWEHTQVLSELREQMEAAYRAYDQAGLYKDDAKARTLEDFGSPQLIARIYRDGLRGLCYRLFFFRRYALHRLLSLVIFCLVHSWLRSQGSIELNIFSDGNYEWRVAIFGWGYWGGIFIIIPILLARLIPRYPKVCKLVGNLAAVGLVLVFSAEIVSEWRYSVRDVLHHIKAHTMFDNHPQWGSTPLGIVVLSLFFLEAIAFFVVLALAGAEIFDLSERRKNRMENRQRMLA